MDSSLVGNVYIADGANCRIRKVAISTGTIATIVGTGSCTYSGNGGQATSAGISYPSGVAIDTSGNIFFTDRGNYRVRKVTVSTGIITLIAGTGSITYSGDNGPATSASFLLLWGLALDTEGNVYVSDQGANRVRKVTVSSGIISTIAGIGTCAYSGDGGYAALASLCQPCGVATDALGSPYYFSSTPTVYSPHLRKCVHRRH